MSIVTSNLTSGFIDLATYDELEKYMYGGNDATAYFVRQTRKATWFTQVPVVLSRASGTPGFSQEWSVSISRAGDYLLYTWVRLVLPPVATIPAYGSKRDGRDITIDTYVSWTPNLMHNLIREAAITFNDLVAARFDNYQLDFWAAFTTPSGKQIGYLNMIGMTDDLITPRKALPQKVLNLPLPFFYSRDSGVALPTAALPYNDMRIQFSIRNYYELLVAWDYITFLDTNESIVISRVPVLADFGTTLPELSSVQVWANYAIVSNDERKRMACAPRDILIEQVQTAPIQSFNPFQNPNQSYDIRFSHAIKVLFFSVRNTTVPSYWSNYTTRETQVVGKTDYEDSLLIDQHFPGSDPIAETSLIYENTQRLAQMGSDYYSLVEPWFAAPVIPVVAGYHLYSYSLDFITLDPLGSTNYGKLTNVSIIPTASVEARVAAEPKNLTFEALSGSSGSQLPVFLRAQTYQFIVTAVNNNIIRISGGKPRRAPNSRLPIGCGSAGWVKECKGLPVCVF
jgi:hypothetical protein